MVRQVPLPPAFNRKQSCFFLDQCLISFVPVYLLLAHLIGLGLGLKIVRKIQILENKIKKVKLFRTC